ncbi:MAG: hypothetical protein NTV46_04470 [Verrucomicrobia bacterium]|nr:hypothetical protein [Verrucomicrobiota bacterium]
MIGGFQARYVESVRTGRSSGGSSGRITITPVDVNLPEKPDLKDLPKATKAKVTWDAKKNVHL